MSHNYIYLVFSKTGTWLSKAIGTLSDMKYTHSSISFDDSFTRMYSFGRTNPDDPFSGGFVEESLYDGVYRNFSESQCIIYRVKVTGEQYEMLKKEVTEFLKDKDKYKYNLMGLFLVKLNTPIKRKYHYFCSQFVSEILIKSTIYEPGIIPELISPKDLFKINNLELVYEGLIRDFTQVPSERNSKRLFTYRNFRPIRAIIPRYSMISRKFSTIKQNIIGFIR